MYKDKTIAVVVPAYNETGFVGEVIETLPDFVDRAYVIDDRSTDGTWEEIRQAMDRVNAATDGGTASRSTSTASSHGDVSENTASVDSIANGTTSPETVTDGRIDQTIVEEIDNTVDSAAAYDEVVAYDERIVAIRHAENRGVGGAIKTGYKLARDHGYDVTAVMSGDGQMDPEILDRIVDPVADGWADYSKGNRLSQRSQFEDMSAWRLFGNTVLSFLSKFVSGYWRMKDPQNGYTAISARTLETLDLDRLYDDYGFSNDILVHLNVHQMRVADVEMDSRYAGETSHIKYSRFIPKLSWLLARRAAWRFKVKYIITDFHPLVFLYLLGTLSAGAGLLFTGWSVASAGVASLHTLASLTMSLLGGLFLTLAMIFDRIESRELERGPNGQIGTVEEER